MKARKKLKVLLLVDTPGPPPANHDFSQELKSEDWETEAHVLDALNQLGHEVRMAGVYDSPDPILNEAKNHPPDVVFNMTELFNERSTYDRNVAGLLEMLDLRYTGTGPTGLTLCKNKGMAKEILAYHRIRFPDFTIVPPGSAIRRPKRLSFPLFIKPLNEEASYGISRDSFVESDEAFEERVRFIHERMNQEALVEEYIEGRELYVSILGNKRLQVFPLREVIFEQVPEGQPRFSTFKAKWDENYRKRWGIQNIFAQGLPNGMAERIARVCRKVYRVLRIRGYGRIDLRLTPEGNIVVLEANPNPNLERDDEFAQSAMKAGLSYEALIQRILSLALMP
jgi:D-alanine-D-alanine ligase